MIDSISQLSPQQVFSNANIEGLRSRQAVGPRELPGVATADSGESFGNLLSSLVKEVDAKGKVAAAETNKLLLGESDNIHQSMIAMQESSLAFTMLVEVRNKLVQSYQELMKMPV